MIKVTTPPVGTTGTLKELQVRPGDVVECVAHKNGHKGLGETLVINQMGYAVSAGINSFTPEFDEYYGRAYRLISRANPTQTVTANGRHYDLTALDADDGWSRAIDKAVYLDVEVRVFDGKVYVREHKPAPVETRVLCHRCVTGLTTELGTCIKRADGSIDWESWEPMP